MALAIGEGQSAGSNVAPSTTTFTLAAGSAVGDLLVVIQANDFYTAANLTTPTGTAASTWTLQNTFDGGTNLTHIKAWTAPVTTAGAQTVITNSTTNDEERTSAVWRITGGAEYSVSSPNSGVTTTSHVTLSQANTSTDAILLCCWTSNNTGSGQFNYTYPAAPFVALTERDVATFWTTGWGSEAISSGAATGTRTATASTTKPFASMAVLITPTAAGTVTKGQEHILNRARHIRASYW